MVFERKDRDEELMQVGEEEPEEIPERSLFSRGWFRALLVVLTLGVIAVIAFPFVADWWTPAPPPRLSGKTQFPPPPPPLQTPPRQTAGSSTPSLAPPSSKSELTPATVQPPTSVAKAPARPEVKPPALTRERTAPKAPIGGEHWIQVGAFKDETNAARLAARLSAEKYPVQQSSVERPVGGAHTVFVVGASLDEVNGKLPAKNYRAEKVGEEIVIRPALPLDEAVSLSKELARQGFAVKIRRSPTTATYHVVRVGGYPDQERAAAVQRELERKGLLGFLVKAEAR